MAEFTCNMKLLSMKNRAVKTLKCLNSQGIWEGENLTSAFASNGLEFASGHHAAGHCLWQQ